MITNKFKPLIIAETLMLYFTVLIVISCWRGPARYRIDDNTNIADLNGITLFSDPDGLSEIRDGVVLARSPNGGTFGLYVPISLSGIEVLQARFELKCPEEYADRDIHIDLMGENYDSDEQESILHLVGGTQFFEYEFPVGENAPDEAMFRVFCLDPVEFELRGLCLYYGHSAPKVQASHWVAVIIAGALLLVTCIVRVLSRKTSVNNGKRIRTEN